MDYLRAVSVLLDYVELHGIMTGEQWTENGVEQVSQCFTWGIIPTSLQTAKVKMWKASEHNRVSKLVPTEYKAEALWLDSVGFIPQLPI
jgi:hypothetical protein